MYESPCFFQSQSYWLVVIPYYYQTCSGSFASACLDLNKITQQHYEKLLVNSNNLVPTSCALFKMLIRFFSYTREWNGLVRGFFAWYIIGVATNILLEIVKITFQVCVSYAWYLSKICKQEAKKTGSISGQRNQWRKFVWASPINDFERQPECLLGQWHSTVWMSGNISYILHSCYKLCLESSPNCLV